jgi:beta-phosphoglucomutase-like phosphatase (HAD superfamily)
MDGLLVDTEAVVAEAMVACAEAMGASLPPDVYHRMIGLPRAASDDVAIAHFGRSFDYEGFCSEVDERVLAACEVGVALKAGVTEILDLLQQLEVPRAIATSSSHEAVRRTLGPSGILPRFQAIVAAGDYARGKPAPDPFLTAAERLGAAPEDCLALEDSHNGVRAAHAAGMMTVMVPDLLAPTDEMRAKCLAIAASLHEAMALIAGAPSLS